MNTYPGASWTERWLRLMVDRCGRVTHWQLFVVALCWVIVGGLILQLVVLPYLFPYAHWGHGLIVGQDSVGFHVNALEHAARIRDEGWSAWEWVPSQYTVSVISVLYAAFVPEPWVALPFNGILFGVTMVSVRLSLSTLSGSPGAGLLALLPFFAFPSFVAIWGQLYKDLATGAGLSLVLCALILAARQGHRITTVLGCLLAAVGGMGLLWLSRSYAMSLTTAATIAFAVVIAFERDCRRGALAVVVAAVVLTAVPSVVQRSMPRDQGRFHAETAAAPDTPVTPSPNPASAPDTPVAPSPNPASAPASAAAPEALPPAPGPDVPRVQPPGVIARLVDLVPRRRTVNQATPRYENCLPRPADAALDVVLYNLCHVREGFVADGIYLKAGSMYDSDVRLRTAGDFIAYVPRALQVALVEPGPSWWARTKQSTIGALGHTIVPIEMILAYAAFALVIVLGGRQIARPSILALVCFCLTYIIFYVVAIPQMGTLYRMRAFAFTIIVSAALTFVFGRLKPAE